MNSFKLCDKINVQFIEIKTINVYVGKIDKINHHLLEG